MENDGDLDIAFANTNTAGWIENTVVINPPPAYTTAYTSSPVFGLSHTVSQALKVITSVAVADITGDGLIDMMSTSQSDNKVAWYTGIGPRTLDLYAGEQFSISTYVHVPGLTACLRDVRC